MAEADDGTADPLAGLQGALSRRIGVARLNDRRLHGRDPGAPALDRTGPAIAVSERQSRGAQLNDPVRPRPVSGARHDEGMADPRPIGLDPRLLRQQVSLHAAGPGRVQHGGVQQPRPLVLRRLFQRPQGVLHVQSGNQTKFAFVDVEISQGHSGVLVRSALANAERRGMDASSSEAVDHDLRP